MKHFFILLIALLLPVSGAVALDHVALKAGVFEPPRAAPEISLRGSDSGVFKLSRYRGKVVVLAFGYTSCAEVCPITLAMLAQARQQLGTAAGAMQVVYVTVDPERDTVLRMHHYLAAFDASFIGATGTPEQLAAVRKAYGISAVKHMVEGSKTDYTVHHSSYLYFIDRQGMLRALMPFGHPPEDIAHDVNLLLKS